jgi:hypothetical protein
MRLVVRRMTETGEMHVENQLGVPLARLVVCDEQGELYQVADLPIDGRSVLAPCTAEDTNASLAPLLAATRPAVPDRFDIDYHTRSFAFNWNYSWSMDDSFAEPVQATGILERNLSNRPAIQQSKRKEFWAYSTAAPPTMPIGIDPVRQVAGLHVIHGEW